MHHPRERRRVREQGCEAARRGEVPGRQRLQGQGVVQGLEQRLQGQGFTEAKDAKACETSGGKVANAGVKSAATEERSEYLGL